MKRMFSFGINVSCTHQGFYTTRDSQIVNVAPECAVDIDDMPYVTKAILPVSSVIKYYAGKGIKRFFLRRTFAMGDILMLVPIIRYLRTLGFDPYLKTERRYFDILNRLGIETISTGFGPDGMGIELDRTIEKDHHKVNLQKFHRIQIYMNAIGLDKYPKKLKWEYDKKNFPQLKQLSNFKFKKKDYVVFQGSGSTKAKSLPKARIEGIINALNAKEIKVIYIGNSVELSIEKPEMVQIACVKYSFPQLFPIFENAKAAVVMDSGPLWLSHFTKTPVVVILGPTNPNTRLIYHPLYPEKVKAVETNKHINCEWCYEAAARCKYQFKCLYISSDVLFNDLYPKLKEVSK